MYDSKDAVATARMERLLDANRSNAHILLTSFLVLALHANGASAQVVEEGLVSYWTLDEKDIEGSTVKDLLGNNDGTISGSQVQVEGKIGEALEFDGDDHVDCGLNQSLLLGNTDLSFGLWFKFISLTGTNYLIGNHSSQNGKYYHLWEQDGRLVWSIDDDVTKTQIEFPGIAADEWYHAFGIRIEGVETRLYVNGALGVAGADQTGDITSDAPMFFGDRFAGNRGLEGIIDEVALYNRALSDAEVLKNFQAKGFGKRHVPKDTATDVSRDTILSWDGSDHVATYNVYFGADLDAVVQADVTQALGVLASSGQDANSLDPGRLDFGRTYFWRVDEVNEAPDFAVSVGDVWSFTTEPFSIPVANISATASSSFGTSLPENTVNGSGLVDDLHNTSAGDMWISTGVPATIEYAFDRVYRLHELWIWNSNQLIEAFVGFGAKEVTVEYSLDHENWAVLEGVAPLAQGAGAEGYAHNNTVDFDGAAAQYVRLTINSVQGFAPQASLSEVRFYAIPTLATRPSPANGVSGVQPDVILSWGRDGREADRHDVYFGTDPTNLPLAGTVNESRFDTQNLALILGTTYHWRVDEVNDAMDPSVWEGTDWRFSTADRIVVDDMESYQDREFLEIWATWVDGFEDPANGSLVGNGTAGLPETSIAHGGRQSLPLHYDNTGAALSETTRTFAPAQDWTLGSPETLVLHFHGTADNSGGRVYVKINDVKVTFDADPTAISTPSWTQWRIDLIDVGLVNSLTVGVEGPSARGVLYVDDILLTRGTP